VARARGLADLAFDVEGLTSREAAAEDLMLGARMMVGIVPALAYHARATIGGGPVDSTFSHLVSEGLARMTPEGGLEPTERGWLLGNEMYGELWDLAEGTIAHSAR
jgi:oxygen-independent coproporphyrinogen-3 oxidase